MVGRNKFFHPSAAEPPFPLGAGLEAWRGFYSSVRPAHKQLMVNVNVCTTAFYVPGNLADSLQAFLNASFSARPSAFCRHVRVKTTHLGYRKTIAGTANFSARQHSFQSQEYGKITVEDYFKRSKSYRRPTSVRPSLTFHRVRHHVAISAPSFNQCRFQRLQEGELFAGGGVRHPRDTAF